MDPASKIRGGRRLGAGRGRRAWRLSALPGERARAAPRLRRCRGPSKLACLMSTQNRRGPRPSAASTVPTENLVGCRDAHDDACGPLGTKWLDLRDLRRSVEHGLQLWHDDVHVRVRLWRDVAIGFRRLQRLRPQGQEFFLARSVSGQRCQGSIDASTAVEVVRAVDGGGTSPGTDASALARGRRAAPANAARRRKMRGRSHPHPPRVLELRAHPDGALPGRRPLDAEAPPEPQDSAPKGPPLGPQLRRRDRPRPRCSARVGLPA